MATTRRGPACPACAVRGPGDARWCGHCGATVQELPGGTVLVRADADGSAADDGGDVPVSRWLGVAVLVAVGALWIAPREATTTTLVGRLDVATGQSSTSPPATDLQLLWRRVVDAVAPPDGVVPRVRPATAGVVLDGEVVAGAATVDLGLPDLWPGPDGALVVADGHELAVADQHGAVRTAHALTGSWRPVGGALGWVAGAAVLADADGRLGAVDPDGTVRWIGEPTWTWDGSGHGSDWLVVQQPAGRTARWVVVDGVSGEVLDDGGPVDRVHDPVVHGSTLVWVDVVDDPVVGLGHPVVVRGRSLDGSRRPWVVDDLQPTSGVPTAISLTVVDDAVAVSYWAVGLATTAVWLRAEDGEELARTTVGGSGRTPEGWPVAAVVGDAIAHVDPVREELRVVSRDSHVRWAVPARPDEGLATVGDAVVVHTPSTTFSSQRRVRVLDAAAGAVRWERVTDSTVDQVVVGQLRGHVGVAPTAPWPVPLREQAWFDPDNGRRRSALRLAASELGAPVEDGSDLTLLGGVARAGRVEPVFLLPDGTGAGQLLGPGSGGDWSGAPPAGTEVGAATTTVADRDLAVRVAVASVVARSVGAAAPLWQHDSAVLLRPDRSVLLPDAVVITTVDGRVTALDRSDGSVSWSRPDLAVTAVTGAGDRVVVGTRDGEVVVLGPDGRVEQRLDVGAAAVEDVAVIDRRVLVTVGRDLVALGRGAAVVEPADRVEVP